MLRELIPFLLIYKFTSCVKMLKLIVFFSMLSFLYHNTEATKNPVNISCQGTSTLSPNSTYKANLDLVISSLTSNPKIKNGFYTSSSGLHSSTDTVYGSFFCRGDLSAEDCKNCVANATKDLIFNCSNHKKSIIWYDQCMVRYSNFNFFSVMEEEPYYILMNLENIPNADNNFTDKLLGVMDELVSKVARDYGSSTKKLATKKIEFKRDPVYSNAECTPDISEADCSKCLRKAISYLPGCCSLKLGARVLLPSCSIRYENYNFYNSPQEAADHVDLFRILVAVVSSVVFIVAILALTYWFFMRKRLKKCRSRIDEIIDRSEYTNIDSMLISLSLIKASTNNFSDDSKLGEGGFGAVYKGTLPDGQEIAAKRLSKCSCQGTEEFKNEIESIAKLQHRNLVRLLGVCFEGEERILVYEYAPNRSLDSILFDAGKKDELDWPKRYKIIVGIARGLLYLHEDSRLRIIHRDLKASNVLLDGEMNPRISDFGTARIFGIDQIEGSTTRIVGTYGYMSPEYVVFGNFSVKSDVFSFGVLILEIISGTRNSSSKLELGEGLLEIAWKHWRKGTSMELIDPALRESCSINEVIKVVRIGLLCVQEDVEDRPTMASVIAMLTGNNISVPLPQQPAFTISSTALSYATSSAISNQFTASSL